jgi:hypothetical protein
MTLQEAGKNIGRNVIYTPFKGCDESQKEAGTITSVNDKFVFVRYSYSNNGIATSPEDLNLEINL